MGLEAAWLRAGKEGEGRGLQGEWGGKSEKRVSVGPGLEAPGQGAGERKGVVRCGVGCSLTVEARLYHRYASCDKDPVFISEPLYKKDKCFPYLPKRSTECRFF